MVIDPTAVWFLLIGCSLAGAARSLRNEFRRMRTTARPRRRVLVGRFVDAAMIGIGTGMGVALLFLALTAVMARIT